MCVSMCVGRYCVRFVLICVRARGVLACAVDKSSLRDDGGCKGMVRRIATCYPWSRWHEVGVELCVYMLDAATMYSPPAGCVVVLPPHCHLSRRAVLCCARLAHVLPVSWPAALHSCRLLRWL